MPQPAEWSVTIFKNGRKIWALSNVRSNGNFRALKQYLKKKKLGSITVNFYYQGAYQYQQKYNDDYGL
jgi:hypothetical protein